MNKSKSLCRLASLRPNEPVAYTHAFPAAISSARLSLLTNSLRRSWLLVLLAVRISSTHTFPLEDLCENFRFFDGIIQSVVRMLSSGTKFGNELALARLCYGKGGFHGKCGLLIKTSRMRERRTFLRKSSEVPV